MEEQEKLVQCIIMIKQAPPVNYYSFTDHNARNAANLKAAETNKDNFYKVVNAVVDAGGVICMDKYHLDTDYRMIAPDIRIKLPSSKINDLKKLAEIVSVTVEENPK